MTSPDPMPGSASPRRLEAHGWRWEVEPGGVSSPGDWLGAGGEMVKETPVKRVTRLALAGRVFYVKRYRHEAVPGRPWKFYFGPSAARREWETARRLVALGIPVVRHVAHGERWGLGLRESVLVTEAFDGRPLDEVPGMDPVAVRAFVERLHAAGVHHSDLHSGNLLGRPPGDLRLVDVDRVGFRAAPQPGELAEMLAFLNISFPLPLDPALRQLSARRRQEQLADRSRRCLRHNREFAPRRHDGLRWHVRLPLLTPAVERILDAPDEFLRNRARLLKPGQTTTVGVGDGLVLKRFNLRKALNLLKDLARPSRAFRAFRKAYHLELAGVPTPRVVAAAERRLLGVLLVRSHLLMEEIPGAVTLQRSLREGTRPSPGLVQDVARLVARLHAEGFTHGDLNERNLVLGAGGRVYLIDLDAVEFVGEVPAAAAARDLARLGADAARHQHLTPADQQMFLRAYCRARRVRAVPRVS